MSDLQSIGGALGPVVPLHPNANMPDPNQEQDKPAVDPLRGMSLPVLDEATLAGPPPAFEVSLMELDHALRDDLARQNAERAFGTTWPDSAQVDAEEAVETAPVFAGPVVAAAIEGPLVPGESQ